MKQKVAFILPVYNEKISTLNKILKQLSRFNVKIIIIDDGSKVPISREDFKSDVIILRNRKNRGLIYAIKKGFRYCLSKGYSHVIKLDGDDQNNINKLNEAFEQLGRYDLINLSYDKEQTVFSIKKDFFVYSSLLYLASGVYYFDFLSEFRIYNKKSMKLYIREFKNQNNYSSSLFLIDVIREGLSIYTIKGGTLYPEEKMRPFPIDGLIALRMTFIRKLLSFNTLRAYLAVVVSAPVLFLHLVVNLVFFNKYNSLLTKKKVRKRK
ncbi:glycosyltransferase [Candidatus Woesearchaeota archaeon]|nr:glycosyltransferase [Candidatus Woesearchaeota archaeon]